MDKSLRIKAASVVTVTLVILIPDKIASAHGPTNLADVIEICSNSFNEARIRAQNPIMIREPKGLKKNEYNHLRSTTINFIKSGKTYKFSLKPYISSWGDGYTIKQLPMHKALRKLLGNEWVRMGNAAGKSSVLVASMKGLVTVQGSKTTLDILTKRQIIPYFVTKPRLNFHDYEIRSTKYSTQHCIIAS